MLLSVESDPSTKFQFEGFLIVDFRYYITVNGASRHFQYTPEKYEISRRESRCILKIKNAGKEDHNAEVACVVEGDRTTCVVNVEG